MIVVQVTVNEEQGVVRVAAVVVDARAVAGCVRIDLTAGDGRGIDREGLKGALQIDAAALKGRVAIDLAVTQGESHEGPIERRDQSAAGGRGAIGPQDKVVQCDVAAVRRIIEIYAAAIARRIAFNNQVAQAQMATTARPVETAA